MILFDFFVENYEPEIRDWLARWVFRVTNPHRALKDWAEGKREKRRLYALIEEDVAQEQLSRDGYEF